MSDQVSKEKAEELRTNHRINHSEGKLNTAAIAAQLDGISTEGYREKIEAERKEKGELNGMDLFSEKGTEKETVSENVIETYESYIQIAIDRWNSIPDADLKVGADMRHLSIQSYREAMIEYIPKCFKEAIESGMTPEESVEYAIQNIDPMTSWEVDTIPSELREREIKAKIDTKTIAKQLANMK